MKNYKKAHPLSWKARMRCWYHQKGMSDYCKGIWTDIDPTKGYYGFSALHIYESGRLIAAFLGKPKVDSISELIISYKESHVGLRGYR